MIIYLRFIAKNVEIKTANLNVSLKGLKITNFLVVAKNVGKKTVKTNKAFYSKLSLEDIADEDYIHAQKVFEEFKLKNLGEYHNLYVQSYKLLLADVFEILEKKCIKISELDPAHFFICTWISIASLFKKDRTKIIIMNK